MIVSTKSSRVFECQRTSDFVSNKLPDGNLPFTVQGIGRQKQKKMREVAKEVRTEHTKYDADDGSG